MCDRSPESGDSGCVFVSATRNAERPGYLGAELIEHLRVGLHLADEELRLKNAE